MNSSRVRDSRKFHRMMCFICDYPCQGSHDISKLQQEVMAHVLATLPIFDIVVCDSNACLNLSPCSKFRFDHAIPPSDHYCSCTISLLSRRCKPGWLHQGFSCQYTKRRSILSHFDYGVVVGQPHKYETSLSIHFATNSIDQIPDPIPKTTPGRT